MASQVTLKALGLNYSPNNLSLPEGSLSIANDVIVRRDNVLESRRGFRQYNEEVGGVGISKQLISYKDRILNHYSNILQFDTGETNDAGEAVFDNFSGTYNEVDDGLRIKSIEANKNLYFTTNKGVKKISARTAADFTTSSGFITDAGAVKALDFTAELDISQGQTSGFLPVDAAVAYRILWGYKDLNDNLILGTPSDSVSVYNYLSNIVPLDLNTFLIMLDNLVQSSPPYTSVLHNSNTYQSESFPFANTFSGNFKVNVDDDASVYASNLLSTAEYMDKFALLADTTAVTNTKPLQINTSAGKGFSATNGVASIDFTSDPAAVFSTGDLIEVLGAANANGSTYTFNINKKYAFTLSPAAYFASGTSLTCNGQTYLSGRTPSANTYIFSTTAGPTASVNAVYSVGGNNYTVISVLTGTGNLLFCTGNVDPPAGPNTLAYVSGTGTGPITYSSYVNPSTTFFFSGFATGNISVGSLYTVSGFTYCALNTVSSGTTMFAIGNGTPPSTGSLALVTGTGGPATPLVYTAVTSTLYTTGTGLPVSAGLTVGQLTSANLNYPFTNYVQSDPVVSSGSIYTNNSQTFTSSSFENFVTLTSTGTGSPTSSGILTRTSGTGDNFLGFSSFSINTLNFSQFNNSSIDTTASKYWTILSVDSVNNRIQFNLKNTVTVAVGNPGAATKIYGYNYRNIIQTAESPYFTPLTDLAVSTPPTHEQLSIIQNTISRLVNRLKSEKVGFVSSNLKNTYINNYNTTTFANVKLNITVPTGIAVPGNYFLQIYRTRNFTCTPADILGVNVTPDDEMRLIFEIFPTSTNFIVDDNYPEALRDTNVNLYTNPVTGEGIAQANDIPPVAKDINRFKNVLFYANTKTRHRLNPFQLLGTSSISNGDSVTISNGIKSRTYIFTLGVQEVTSISVVPGTVPSNLVAAGIGKYFTINSANDETEYYVWYRVDNVGNDPALTIPALSGKTGIRVDLLSADTASVIRDKTLNTINSVSLDFIAATGTPLQLIVTNTNFGKTTNADVGTVTGFITVSTTIEGNGEDAIATPPRVLLSIPSSSVTASQAIDETARSLVRVINKQSDAVNPINAYYISSSASLPGQMNLESKTIDDVAFYVQASNTNTGISFNPNIDPFNSDNNTIERVSATQVKFTTTASHGLNNGDRIFISRATVPTNQYITGIYTVSNVTTTPTDPTDTFTITAATSSFATAAYDFAWSKLADVSVSNNETKPNRVYYSKLSQPEAVPLLNYFDIGSSDKQILRIFPLRDSLFVFKEDGLYRISGETAPFVVTLFDSSCVLLAPDTVSVANNIIYGWTSKGISNITEAGVTEVSRPIDTVILKLASANYVNFTKAAWGLGYDSDNSYTVYTCANIDDTIANIGFRFSNLTNTWTNFIRSQTCGVINLKDDKIYTGNGEIAYINQERKNFNRTDYSDENFTVTINEGAYSNKIVTLPSILGISEGDVLTQTQIVSIYEYSSLLQKLDIDPNVGKFSFSTSGAGTTITVSTFDINNPATPMAHGLQNGDWITINSCDSNPIIIGDYQISGVTTFTFNITVDQPLVSQATTASILKRNYEKTLTIFPGSNMRAAIVKLASYLTSDPALSSINYTNLIASTAGSILSVTAGNPGVIVGTNPLVNNRKITISGINTTIIPSIIDTYTVTVSGTGLSTTFSIPEIITTGQTTGPTGLIYATNDNNIYDIEACFNAIINNLNGPTSGTSYKNYESASDSVLFEAVILSVDTINSKVTLNLPIQLLSGQVNIYKSIPCEVEYAPITFGDPLTLKQVYESTLMFANKAFTRCTASFSSDLKPEFTSIQFEGQGNGEFGFYSEPGFGYGFFGGSSNGAPCRTIIPRQNQRCRYINTKFNHNVAREIWTLYGITLTFNPTQSTRAYR